MGLNTASRIFLVLQQGCNTQTQHLLHSPARTTMLLALGSPALHGDSSAGIMESQNGLDSIERELKAMGLDTFH